MITIKITSAVRGAALIGLVAALTAVAGCERLNPGWCEEHAVCGVDEFCDPATNTCRTRDAGQPDLDLTRPDQTPDLPRDQAADRPVDAPLDMPPPDKTPVMDTSPESSPMEAGAG
jgi:hypothetical protein